MDNIFKISIYNLNIQTIIGILEIERCKKQTITVSMDLFYEKHKEIIDYSLVRELLVDIFSKNEFYYLEDAIEYVIGNVTNNFNNIVEISMTISKPDIFDDCIVSVNKKINLG